MWNRHLHSGGSESFRSSNRRKERSGNVVPALKLETNMNIFKRFFSSPHPTGTMHPFLVKCKRCGETIQGQINVNNEPSLELDEKGKPYYTCRKVLIGSGHCFQRIEVVFKFDENRRVLDQEITGGDFIKD
jgi:hypothetical protein